MMSRAIKQSIKGAQMRMNRFSCFFHPRTLELAGGKKIITRFLCFKIPVYGIAES